MICPPLPWGGEVAAAPLLRGYGFRSESRIQTRIPSRIPSRLQSRLQSRIQTRSQSRIQSHLQAHRSRSRIDAPIGVGGVGVGVGGGAYRCGPSDQKSATASGVTAHRCDAVTVGPQPIKDSIYFLNVCMFKI